MFIDVSLGILSALVATSIFSVNLNLYILLIAIFLALIPDIDLLIYILRGYDMKFAYKHRDILHLPVVYLVISLFIYVINPLFSLIFFFSTFFHFLHDSIGIGWGVSWLWPFSKKHFAFFYIYQSSKKPHITKKLVYVFKQDEIDELYKKYGDHELLKNVYLKLNIHLLIELLIFIIVLVILYQHGFEK